MGVAEHPLVRVVVISIASRCYSDQRHCVGQATYARSCRDLYSVTMLFQPGTTSRAATAAKPSRDLYSVTMLFRRRVARRARRCPSSRDLYSVTMLFQRAPPEW